MALLRYVSLGASVFAAYILGSLIPYVWRKRRDRAILQRNFPAPAAAHWLLGHVPLLSGLSYETLMLFSRWTKEYPRYFLFLAGPLDTKLVLHHAETVKIVMKTNEPKQHGRGGLYSFAKVWLGDGLLCSSGDKYRRNRKLVTPAFHLEALKGYVSMYNEVALALVGKLNTLSANTGKSVEISSLIRACSLEIIMRAAFSCFAPGDSETYLNKTDYLVQQVLKRALTPLYHFNWLYDRTQEGKQFHKNVEYVSNVAAAVIDQRRSELAQYGAGDNTNRGNNNRKGLDLLDRLLMARDEDGNGLSREDLLSEVRTIITGGFDTVKSGVVWLIYNLATHRECQDLARYAYVKSQSLFCCACSSLNT